MHLYEIKAAVFSRLVEQTTSDIERDLEKTAGNIKRTSALGQGDETSAGAGAGDNLGAGEFGQAPDLSAAESPLQQATDDDLEADLPPDAGPTDEETDELLMKKVDSILLSSTRGHSYIKNYNHQENSKIHPYRILGMQLDELNQLRTMARNKANMESFGGEIGVFDNPDIKFFQDLVSFADKVMKVKKSSTKEYKDKKEGKTASTQKRKESNLKPGKVKKKVNRSK